MPQWLDILLGIVAGTTLVGAALLWACWPRKAGRRSRLASPTGDAGDPTPGGSPWSGDGGGWHGGGGHDGGGGHGGW